MFSTFDVLVESSLHDKAEKEFMTVGWGAKETQFHGSVGKNARKKQDIEVRNTDDLDQTITCCWRNDGEYFAVNFVGSSGRMFKVFNKEGVMQYVSEVCANLQVPIAWKPRGLWIAKPEIYDNKYSITLFERNGLKHNELILPFSPDVEVVTSLCWNQDSDILLISTKRSNIHSLYFYTINNYHWYLKQYMEFENEIVYNWSQNFAEPKQLYIFESNGDFSILKFDFVINHSNGKSDNDESIIAVIDGKKLLLSNIKSQIIPPPMSSLEVATETTINAVSFLLHTNAEFDSNSFMTIDHLKTINLYSCIFTDTVNGRRLKEVLLIKKFQLKQLSLVSHAVWINPNQIILASDEKVFLCDIDAETIVSELQLEEIVGGVVNTNENGLIAQLIDGTLIGFEVTNNELTLCYDKEHPKLPEFCEKFIIRVSSKGEALFYSHKSLKKKLYFNAKDIATEVTSFTITNDGEFLIYTTIGELKFIKIDKNPEEVIETRRIERGSRILTLVKDKSQILFQLPRGNLEAISPRILSMKIIRKHLDASNYKLAFELLRKERINLNLIIDLQPQKFLNEMNLFIEQIDNINWLNLFLTELKNEDITITMYKYCEKSEGISDELYLTENKSSYICRKMLKIFDEIDRKKYLLPSITCHVKNENLENALQTIWDMKKSGKNDNDADDAIKYLLYLVDINLLYNIALGMYDYQLVMFVAQKSQKDPKEYVPFLQDLNKLNQQYAKFKIDCFLKRFTKAIGHVAALCENDEGKFEECTDIIKKHSIYEAAMSVFKPYTKLHNEVCVLFGDYLRTKGKLLEASLMYERGNDFNQALSSARNVLDWKRCLILARKCNYSEDALQDLATKLVSSLTNLGRFIEASEILRKFNVDSKLLIETLLSGRLYSQAMLEISMHGNCDLIDSTVKPCVINDFAELIKTVDDDKNSFLQQKERLLSVRKEKLRKFLNPPEEEDDMFSDTTSINSQSSRNTANTMKTFRSSKKKRKHERKLLNMKEGNKFEDLALLDSLWKLIHKIISSENQNLLKDTIVAGVELDMDNEAKLLQVKKKNYILLIITKNLTLF